MHNYTLRTVLLGLLLSMLLTACGQSEQERQRAQEQAAQRAAFKEAVALADDGNLLKADETISKVVPDLGPGTDSASMLHKDLSLIAEADNEILYFDENAIRQVQAGSYKSSQLHLAVAQPWYNKQLLASSKRLPELRAAEKKAKAKAIIAAAKQKREDALAAVREAREKRAAAALVLRDAFLNDGMDIKVSVSGKNKDVIRLEYALFNDVWSYKMNQRGDISTLLDMGFKKITLTDGYDYTVNWTRNK